MKMSPHTMEGFAEEIFALADHLSLRKFSIVGWSFGGMIAQQAALEQPERIEHLVLTGTAGVGELPQRFETWSETLSRITSEGVVAALDRTVRTWFVSGEADPFLPYLPSGVRRRHGRSVRCGDRCACAPGALLSGLGIYASGHS